MEPLKCIGCKEEFTKHFKIHAKMMCLRCYNLRYYRRRTPKKEFSDKCIDCGVVFNEDVKRQALNRCRRCYNNNYYSRGEERKDKPTNCVNCGLAPGDINKKGKVVQKLVSGYCKSCYAKRYHSEACNECKSCGVKFMTAKLSCLCDDCETKKDRKTARRMAEDFTPKRSSLSAQELQDMLTLFRRYKNGSQSRVDAFRVVDLYLTVYEGHPYVYNSMVDSYEEESQIVLMLRMLKKVYDNV